MSAPGSPLHRYRFVPCDRPEGGLHAVRLFRFGPPHTPAPATDSHGYPLASYLRTDRPAAPEAGRAAEADAAYLLRMAAPKRSAAAVAARRALVAAAGPGPARPTPDDWRRAGALLRARREALGLSQRDVAAAAGVSRSALAALEAGQRTVGAVAGGRIAEALARLEAAAQEPRDRAERTEHGDG